MTNPVEEFTDAEELQLRADLENAYTKWREANPAVSDSPFTDGVPNEWLLDFGELEDGTWDRFHGTDHDQPSVGAEIRGANVAPGDGDRGLDRRYALGQVLALLRTAPHPLSTQEIMDELAKRLLPDKPPSKDSLKRYLTILCDFDFVRQHGHNRASVYVAGGPKPLRDDR